ncbi:MAG: LegC family aminotransferase [Coxiellaceae bacterium]|nr:LegC family aminotransferase [Coxiellaceae bacterium]
MTISNIINAICSNIATENKMIALHEPIFSGRELEYVQECITTGWVSSVGKFVDRFERELVDFTGASHAVVTVNGTSALHMCYLLAGVSAGDEVLVPTLTFIATCNALAYCNATPHFYDCEEKHLGVDIEKLSDYLKETTVIKNKTCYNKITGKIIRALCVMHTFGHPVDLDPILALAEQYHLILIEDAAEALGSYYKNKHVGNHGLLSALSFNGNKIITTGGGGAIITNDETLARQAKHLTTTAKQAHPWEYYHTHVGYNYRMPNINAALGCAQLEQLPYFLKIKRALAEGYQKAFSAVTGVRFLQEPIFAQSNYWLNAMMVENKSMRDSLVEALNAKKIAVRPLWELMHRLPMYCQAPRMDLATSESIAERVINIPSSVVLGRI